MARNFVVVVRGNSVAKEAAYLSALKAYAKARYGNAKDVADAVADLDEESDRGALILAATGVEDMLEYKILEKMPVLEQDEATRKQIFEHDGPISSFSRKITVAYALGIIDDPYRKLIDLVREVRNACAHSRKPISLKRAELQGIVKVILKDELPAFVGQQPKHLRDGFIIKTAQISHYIRTGEKLEGPEGVKEYYRRVTARGA